MVLDNLVIIQDTREKEPLLFASFGVDVRRDYIEYGDYSILGFEKEFSIERKRDTAELAQNVVEKRFERELKELNLIKHAYILCEFPQARLLDFPANSGIPPYLLPKIKIGAKFLRKRVHELQNDYPNIQWIFCDDKISALHKGMELINEFYNSQKTK